MSGLVLTLMASLGDRVLAHLSRRVVAGAVPPGCPCATGGVCAVAVYPGWVEARDAVVSRLGGYAGDYAVEGLVEAFAVGEGSGVGVTLRVPCTPAEFMAMAGEFARDSVGISDRSRW